jgi:hypothetical protein
VTKEGDAITAQGPVVEIVPAAVAGRLRVRGEPRERVGKGGGRLIHEPALDHPPDDVASSRPAREPRRSTAGEEHLAAGAEELLGELTPGLAAAHHEHAARRQAGGVAIVLDVDLQQVGGQGRRALRSMSPLVRAGRDDDGPGPDIPGRGPDDESLPERDIRLQRCDLDALTHRRTEARGVPLQVRHDLVAWHVAVRIVAGVGAAGEPNGPVRRDETEGLPPAAP